MIAVRHEAIGFYSNAENIYIPVAAPEEIIRYLKDWGVEYLIIRPGDAGYDFVRPITRKDFLHPDLTLVKEFNDQTIVWKVNLTEKEKKVNRRTSR